MTPTSPAQETHRLSISPPPPADLRHMTSNQGLVSPTNKASNRLSQHLRAADARLGSPTSIPSSPTSVRSSSSAIFERDIEPIVPPSPPHAHAHPPNPHRIPRAKGTEQLEQSVPSVLDSAAAILANLEPDETVNDVAVVSPSNSVFDSMVGRSSGFASPIGSFRSRSPSPIGSRVAPQPGGILLSIPTSPGVASPSSILGLQSPGGPVSSSPPSIRPVIQPTPVPSNDVQALQINTAIAPALVTPTSAYFSTTSSVADQNESPTTTTLEHPPTNAITSPALSPSPRATHKVLATTPSPPTHTTSLAPSTHAVSPTTSPHPLPSHVPKKRLSFMSYSDLLTSTPATTQPLSSLTTSASSDPPPHIPSVSGLNIVSAAQSHTHSPVTAPTHAGSLAAALSTVSSSPSAAPGGGGASTRGAGSAAPSIRGFSVVPVGGLTHPGKRDSIALLDNVGGEWEREGLGRGLEERLDALAVSPPVAIHVGKP